MRDIVYLCFELPPRFHCCQPVLAWGVAGGGTGAFRSPDVGGAAATGGGFRGCENVGAGEETWFRLRESDGGAADPQPPGVEGKGGVRLGGCAFAGVDGGGQTGGGALIGGIGGGGGAALGGGGGGGSGGAV